MTTIVALTGGIASGKSTFSKEVKKRKIKLLDSDEQVRRIYKNPKKAFLNFLKEVGLGDSIKKGVVNKKLISSKIFSDKKVRKKLENYIFKIIRKQRKEFIIKEKKRKSKIVFVDIPLLFENNLSGKFDLVISVISHKKERYKRLKKSKQISKTMFNKIIQSQTTDAIRKKHSHIVVYNNDTIKKFQIKINKILDEIIL